ncbi:hypothetical protein F5Y19DRAFT_472855 [Xylariaceae sp. FL1651]|nr:hypothetical protein F5Y19DRAFT_472855 [Xylariaceae sp. FL1651]
MAIAERITAFSDAFAPFFDVVNVYIQIKQEWAAIFWAWLKPDELFDRVATMLEEIALILPQYEAWFNICKRTRSFTNTDRLSQSLAMLYDEFIELTIHIYFMFTRRRKGRLRRAFQTSGLMLRPFDARFSLLKERIEKHRAWFETEAQIQQHDLIHQTYADFRQFLDSSSDNKETGEWVTTQRAENARRIRGMKSWINSPDYQSLLRIIEDLQATVPPTEPGDEKPNVVYFHYSMVDRCKDSSPIASLRAISEQLIHAHRGDQLTLDSLAMIQSEEGSGQHTASTTDVRAVINILLRQHPTFIVIDGVDECNNPEALLEEVRGVCLDHDCRVTLLGRPNTTIPSQWKAYTPGNDWMVELDTSRILGNRVRKLEHLLQLTEMNLISALSIGAEGIFLWAKLLLNLLQSPALSPVARLGILKEPRKLVSLDALYHRILCSLGASSVDEQGLACKVFWLLFSAMALNTASLHTILAIHPGRPTTELDYLTDYPQCIPRVTCALVGLHAGRNMYWYKESQNPQRMSQDLVGSANQRAFTRLSTHQCAYPFDRVPSTPTPECAHQNTAEVQGSHLLLAETCLSYLIFDVPSQPLQAIRKEKLFCGFGLEAVGDSLEASAIDADMIEKRFKSQNINVQHPFLQYSALCWVHHLATARSGDNRVQQASNGVSELCITLLSQFLINRFTVTMWTEASCHNHLVPRMGRLNLLIAKLMPSPILPTRPITDLRAREYAWVSIGLHQLSGALKDLAERFGERLLVNPSLIWQKDIERAEDREFWPNWEEEEEAKRMEVDGEDPSQHGSWLFDFDVPPARSLA